MTDLSLDAYRSLSLSEIRERLREERAGLLFFENTGPAALKVPTPDPSARLRLRSISINTGPFISRIKRILTASRRERIFRCRADADYDGAGPSVLRQHRT